MKPKIFLGKGKSIMGKKKDLFTFAKRQEFINQLLDTREKGYLISIFCILFLKKFLAFLLNTLCSYPKISQPGFELQIL